MSFWSLRLEQNTNKKFDYFCPERARAETIKIFISILVQTKTSKRHFEINWPLGIVHKWCPTNFDDFCMPPSPLFLPSNVLFLGLVSDYPSPLNRTSSMNAPLYIKKKHVPRMNSRIPNLKCFENLNHYCHNENQNIDKACFFGWKICENSCFWHSEFVKSMIWTIEFRNYNK